MPRTMSVAMEAAQAAPLFRPAVFVEIGFRTTTVRMWSGVGEKVWNGQTWLGMGSLLSIAAPEDAATVEARGISISISGLDPALLADAVGDFQVGLPVAVYLNAFDAAGALIDSADPLPLWVGRTDVPDIHVAPEEVTITMACESRLLEMNVAVDRRLTHEDQQLEHPGDLGLQFVAGLQEMTLYWGQSANSTNNI